MQPFVMISAYMILSCAVAQAQGAETAAPRADSLTQELQQALLSFERLRLEELRAELFQAEDDRFESEKRLRSYRFKTEQEAAQAASVPPAGIDEATWHHMTQAFLDEWKTHASATRRIDEVKLEIAALQATKPSKP